MEKPFVVCHICTSLDGKLDGAYQSAPAAAPALAEYGKLRSFYRCEATLYGTVTMARGFSDGLLKRVPAASGAYPKEDWFAPHQEAPYIISVDPRGTLAFSSGTLEKKGRPKAHIVQALTQSVSAAYLAYLRQRGVSYLFAGKDSLDCALLLHKLEVLLGIQRLMLAGGGYMNGTFLQERLIDELSVVVAPVADGDPQAVSLFERHDFLPKRPPAAFSLIEAKPLEGDVLWLRYVLQEGDK